MIRVSVLFVCRGNICRSPLAKAAFEYVAKTKGIKDAFLVDSAGTHGDQIGNGADKRAQKVAMKRGLDLSHHRARQIDSSDFNRFEYILVMDHKNLEVLTRLRGPQIKSEIHMVLAFAGLSVMALKDPFRGQEEDFNTVLDTLMTAIPSIIDRLHNTARSLRPYGV